jgi:predicted Zn-dependent protease
MKNTQLLRRLGISICLICLGFVAGGCATDQAVISQAAQMNTQLEPAIMQDPELAQYLQQVGDRIIGAAKALDAQGYGPKSHKNGDNKWMFGNDMKFHFVNSKTVNAFTTGGDHMYVYNALFQMCKDEAELAAVMSHEYGHVYARHVGKGMNRQYGLLAAAAALGGAGYLVGGEEHGAEYASLGATAGMAGGQFLNMGFTRKDEAEADKLGFNFYTHAGWDPTKFAEFFQEMIDAGYDKTPAIASDHPTLASRVEDARRRVKELPPQAASWQKPPIADAAKFKELQARAAQVAKTTPDDSSLQNSQQLLAALPRSCIIPYTTQDEVKARQALAKRTAAKQAKAHGG